MKRVVLMLIAVLLLAPPATRAGQGKGGPGDGEGGPGAPGCSLHRMLVELPSEHLGTREASDLAFMREEEKLSRDVYLSLHERWGLRIFRQIAGGERRHMREVRVLIDKYGIEDPVAGNGLGVFTDGDLQALYESLTDDGAASPESALLVGAAIEELNLRELKLSLGRANNQDLALLYQNLMKGSRNHLRAFTRALARRGIVYEPVYLTPEEYQAIVDMPREQGVVDAAGEWVCGGRIH